MSAKLSGCTFAQVRAILGEPDRVAGPTIGGDPAEDNEDLWVYNAILRNPKTGGPDSAQWMIRFRFGRVYLSCIPMDMSGLRNFGNGLENVNPKWEP